MRYFIGIITMLIVLSECTNKKQAKVLTEKKYGENNN